ncbi:MAG: hypothetical protein EBV19_11470, partial [Flavobacteriia bacterium]|nr:hypothetical protein [Flavobacteriia bacterium]
IQIKGLSFRNTLYSKTTLTISHNAQTPGSAGPSFTIRDLGDKSIVIALSSIGGTYGGGTQTDGGNGGNIILYNVAASSITSDGGDAGGLTTRIGGTAGNISLFNCDVGTISSLGGLGGGGGSSFNRGGGDIYVENSKISTINYDFDPVNTRSLTIINSIYTNSSIPSASSLSKRIINSYNSSTQNAVLSNIITGSNVINHNFSIIDNNLSGILNNLTLHDNQIRPHLTGNNHSLTIDFASGIYINNSDIYGNLRFKNNNIIFSGDNTSLNFTSGARLIISGNSVLTGIDLSPYATITNLASTGSTLDNKISSLSGTLTPNYATITNLASTGSTLDNK